LAKGKLKLQWQFKSLKFKVENLFITCEARPFLKYKSYIWFLPTFVYFFLAHNQHFMYVISDKSSKFIIKITFLIIFIN